MVAEDGRPLGILTLDDIVAVREPQSIVAHQIREWSIARSDMGYSGGTTDNDAGQLARVRHERGAAARSNPKSATTVARGERVAVSDDDVGPRATCRRARHRGRDAHGDGHPASSIANLAERENVDLVVIGRRGLGPVQRLLGRERSEAVSRRVRCDLLIVHPGREEENGA